MVLSRAALDAKVVISTRPVALATCSRSPSWTPASDPDGSSWKTLVESQTKASTPSSPIRVSVSELGGSASTGVSSIFQSPVWKMRPCGVSISRPLPSGIEWASATKVTLNGPSSTLPSALDDVERDMAGQPLFLELAGDQPGGERRRVERHLEVVGEVGKRADMVLVAVGEDDPGELVLLLLDELQLGQDQVDARVIGVGEGQPEVDHQPLAAAAVEVDVHADLARPAERAEQELFARGHAAADARS